MIPATHFSFANILYEHIEAKTNFKLDYKAFIYGNMIPDFNKKDFKYAHTMEESIEFINLYADNIMKGQLGIYEFSMWLGVICHFTCDYFCLYHCKPYWNKNILEHFRYEVALHFKLLKLLSAGKIKIKYTGDEFKDLKELISQYIKKYKLQKNSISKDISYALVVSAAICDTIVYSSEIFEDNKKVII